MNSEFDPPLPLDPTTEESLTRLIRCMNEGERFELLEAVLKILFSRCSRYKLERDGLPPEEQRRLTGDVVSIGPIDADADEQLEEDLRSLEPYSLPRGHYVDLDLACESFDLLEGYCPRDVFDLVFGGLGPNSESFAELTADKYLTELNLRGYPFTSEFWDDPSQKSRDGWTELDYQDVKRDFIAYLLFWRENVIRFLEEKNPPESHEQE